MPDRMSMPMRMKLIRCWARSHSGKSVPTASIASPRVIECWSTGPVDSRKRYEGSVVGLERGDLVEFRAVGSGGIVSEVQPQVDEHPCVRGGDDVLAHAQYL